MTKGLRVYCPSPMFPKTCLFILLHSFSPVQFLQQFPSPYPFATFFFFCFLNSPQPRSHKPYPQYKTFLNIQAAPSSAAFCNNAVFLTTPSSSMHFFSFFDVLPSDPTTTGMTLELLVFHSFDFSL